jgi:uncharacterized membrane-anchored protein YhcB (DUF1043 family)
MKQEQEQQSALDYFWKQIGNKLDSYQKDLFSQFYEKAKVIEKELDNKSDLDGYKNHIDKAIKIDGFTNTNGNKIT